MQRFSYRESVLLGYSPPKTLMESSSSPKAPDIDFNDVFGGPPRRSSIQETRYSFGDNSDSSSSSSSFRRTIDETFASSRKLSGLGEKPVFGEEGMNRSRYSKTDFFDDIFRGNDRSSSPRKYDMKDPFAARLPSVAEPFGSSLPTRFSLLNKGMDLPTFGSPTRSTSRRSQDGSSNGLSHKGNSIEDSTTSSVSKDGAQFHFSIYKWENKGVVLPLDVRGNGKLKEQDELQRCSSAKGWIGSESVSMESKAESHNSFRSNDRMSSNAKSFRVEHDKRGEKTIKPRSKTLKLLLHDEHDNEQGNNETIRNDGTKDISQKSDKKLYEIIDGENTKKPNTMKKASSNNKDASTTRVKGNYGTTRNDGTKDISKKSDKKLHETLDDKTVKKPNTTKRSTSNNFETSTTRVKGSPTNSGENGKGRVRGKVKDFIKIFNKDASSKPTTDDICHDTCQHVINSDTIHDSRSSRQSEQRTIEPENEPNVTMTQRGGKIHVPDLQTKKSSLEIPVVNHLSKDVFAKSTNDSVTDSVSVGSKTIIEDPRDSFDVNFLIEDLTPEERNFPEFGIDSEEIKAIDAKIQKWSTGKEGNIRSMLSTLQYVLWADSGWKPVPLVDIIEGPAVKRSYQKALLCLHPDKLQQKGADSEQKYIAEKVFDVLQDAWTHFSSLGSV